MSASFGALKQIEAGLLNVGYAEAGPADGLPSVLRSVTGSSVNPEQTYGFDRVRTQV
jgi:hypothetical protein